MLLKLNNKSIINLDDISTISPLARTEEMTSQRYRVFMRSARVSFGHHSVSLALTIDQEEFDKIAEFAAAIN